MCLPFGVCGVVAVAAQVQYKFCGTILRLDSHFWGIGGAGIIWEDKETERDIEYSYMTGLCWCCIGEYIIPPLPTSRSIQFLL